MEKENTTEKSRVPKQIDEVLGILAERFGSTKETK